MTSQPYRIELPLTPEFGPVNAYLFTGPQIDLIDTGPATPESWAALVSGLAQCGVAVEDIDRVVITHPHYDHFAQAGRIAATSEAKVWIADVGAAWLTDAKTMQGRRQAYYETDFLPAVGLPPAQVKQVLAGMQRLFDTVAPVPANRLAVFALGEQLDLGGESWTVLHTPGHSSGQTCFHQPASGQFLASDMLLGVTPTPVVEAPLPGETRRPVLPQFLDSLAVIEELDVSVVYPGHGEPFSGHRARIEAQRTRINNRKEECFAFIRDGQRTIVELYQAMYAGNGNRAGMAAIWMVVGYTDLLLAEGRIAVDVVDGVWHFWTAS